MVEMEQNFSLIFYYYTLLESPFHVLLRSDPESKLPLTCHEILGFQ